MAKIAVKAVQDNGVEWGFTDGEVVSVTLDQFSPEIVKQLALHGLSQKGGDAYSGAKDPEEARGLLLKVVERLEQNEWRAAREAGSGGKGKVSDLARALAEVTGKDLSEVIEKLDEMDKAQKATRRKHPAVAAVLARLAAERAAAKAEKAEEEEIAEEDLL